MKRIMIGCAVATAALVASVGTASAGQPVVSGCVGASVSTNAQALQPYGRNFLSAIAPRNAFGTVGNAVHLLQAGVIPDGEYANTCNP
jgi:hypothetical protein